MILRIIREERVGGGGVKINVKRQNGIHDPLKRGKRLGHQNDDTARETVCEIWNYGIRLSIS